MHKCHSILYENLYPYYVYIFVASILKFPRAYKLENEDDQMKYEKVKISENQNMKKKTFVEFFSSVKGARIYRGDSQVFEPEEGKKNYGNKPMKTHIR